MVSGLSFLGWKSAVITGPYRDEASKLLNRNFERLGVRKIEVNHGGPLTPRIIEEFFPGSPAVGHRFSVVCPRCGRAMPKLAPLNEKGIDSLAIHEFDVFYSDRASKGIALLRGLFKDKGSWTVYEPNSARNGKSLVSNAYESHIVKFSADKVPAAVAETIRTEALKGNTLLIVRTMGEQGLTYSYRKRDNRMSQWNHLNSQPAPGFIDSCGAGDWCTVGMLYSLVYNHPRAASSLTQQEVVAALQYGQVLAAISCCFLGAQGLIYGDMDKETEKRFWGSQRGAFPQRLNPEAPSGSMGHKCCDFCLLEKGH